jgi:hypothetical protein
MIWALLMIVPDLYRTVRPLGSFGLMANFDGLIYDIKGPFLEETASPAFRSGIRKGDRIDLSQMRCVPIDTPTCATVMAVIGGQQLVNPGRTASLFLAATEGRPARQIGLVAAQRPIDWMVGIVLILDEIGGILFVLAAAWLVWTRPTGMSWGFFLYAIWFNPGQDFQFYALLQQWPAWLFAQYVAGVIAQATGYAGFLLFVLRFPANRSEPLWRPVERALPLVAIAVAALQLLNLAYLFGYRTETVARMAFLAGYVVDAAALIILLVRRKHLAPLEYQRMRWVIWGCLIGLPAFILAEVLQQTTLLTEVWGDFTPPEEVPGLFYLLNGVLCFFVFEAVRRPRVVSVSIPLRRVTILGLLLSVPTLFVHQQVDRIQEELHLPGWIWIAIASVMLFLISRLHEFAVDFADRRLNPAFHRRKERLGMAGEAILSATSFIEIEHLLLDEPLRTFGLASAAIFREEDGVFRRHENGAGWNQHNTATFAPTASILAGLAVERPLHIGPDDADQMQLPFGLQRPVLAVSVGNRLRCFAIAFYGPHESGADLDSNEGAVLGKLAENAALAYAQVETNLLRRQIKALERQLKSS